jgi:hypothetical protein
MILKDGESLVHLKIRIRKEIAELSPEDTKSYIDEAIRDIYNAALAEKIPVNEARALIENLDPEFYTKPNELRSASNSKILLGVVQIVLLSGLALVLGAFTLSVIASMF